MEELTHSAIYNSTDDIKIEENVKVALSEITKSSNIIGIYSMNARAVYFFPVASDVYQLSIQIYPLTPEIVAKIMTKVSEFSSKVIYSTGLCLVENRCFWEGFLQEKDLTKDIEEIQIDLKSIAEVKAVIIVKVSK